MLSSSSGSTVSVRPTTPKRLQMSIRSTSPVRPTTTVLTPETVCKLYHSEGEVRGSARCGVKPSPLRYGADLNHLILRRRFFIRVIKLCDVFAPGRRDRGIIVSMYYTTPRRTAIYAFAFLFRIHVSIVAPSRNRLKPLRAPEEGFQFLIVIFLGEIRGTTNLKF